MIDTCPSSCGHLIHSDPSTLSKDRHEIRPWLQCNQSYSVISHACLVEPVFYGHPWDWPKVTVLLKLASYYFHRVILFGTEGDLNGEMTLNRGSIVQYFYSRAAKLSSNSTVVFVDNS